MGNLSKNKACRDAIVDSGGRPALTDLLNDDNDTVKYSASLAKAFLSDASKGFEHGELIFIIQSLKQSKELNPKIDLEIDKLLTILENLK